LLQHVELVIAGQRCRLCEIEFYLYSCDHADPFCHRHPLQQQHGRWYFHRVGSAYRGGSFKGLDVTFANGGGFGGILIRGVQLPDGTIVSGPARLVDVVLRLTGCTTVAALDARLQPRQADDPRNCLFLQPAPQPVLQVWSTARVGLTLRRERASVAALRFWARPYRFLTQPRALAAGRAQLIIAWHQQGKTVDQIQQLLGTPARTIRNYLDAYLAGRHHPQPLRAIAAGFARSLAGPALCYVYGLLDQLQHYSDAELARGCRGLLDRSCHDRSNTGKD
jgi:hypothetical protein